MSKLLIIAEKPSVARDIAAALGGSRRVDKWFEADDYIVYFARGHLVQLYVPESETGGRDLASLPLIPERFSLRPFDDDRKEVYDNLERLMARPDVDAVVNACDAGREGELIFRLIYENARCAKPMKRMWLRSMTRDAIVDSYRNLRPGSEFDALARAARSRNEADWIVGINSSRGISRLRERESLRHENLSVGRVQTPTLAILVHQERKIQSFVATPYFEVHGTFGLQDGDYIGRWHNPSPAHADKDDADAQSSRLQGKAEAERIAAKCRGVAPSSVTDEIKPVLSHSPRLFDLTSLQREANRRYGMSAQRTLDVAQSLYEKAKAITYPRTDSTALPEDYLHGAAAVMRMLSTTTDYGSLAAKVLDNRWGSAVGKKVFDNSAVSDHFAIIPTDQVISGLQGEEELIYDLVVRRFIAAFYPPAEHAQTVRTTMVAGETFRASGRVLVSPGWLEVYGEEDSVGAEDDDASDTGKAKGRGKGKAKSKAKDRVPPLCALAPGESAVAKKMEVKSLKTRAPSRFTEASLLSAMEGAGRLVEEGELRAAMKDRGLGTPATRAPTIETLLKERHGEAYVRREGRHLVPTEKGMRLIEFLEENHVGLLASPRMTGEWEHKLRKMESGGYAREDFMAEIGKEAQQILDIIKDKAAQIALPDEVEVTAPCPKCGSPLKVSLRTVDCQAQCGFRLWLVVAERRLTTEIVDALLRNRRADSVDGFISKAKQKHFTANLVLDDEFKVVFDFGSRAAPDGQAAAKEKVACPKCGKAMRRISGGKGFFWGCTAFREGCKATLDDRDGRPVVKEKGIGTSAPARTAAPSPVEPQADPMSGVPATRAGEGGMYGFV